MKKNHFSSRKVYAFISYSVRLLVLIIFRRLTEQFGKNPEIQDGGSKKIDEPLIDDHRAGDCTVSFHLTVNTM